MSDELQVVTVERNRTANGGWEWFLSVGGAHVGTSIFTDPDDATATWATMAGLLLGKLAKEFKA